MNDDLRPFAPGDEVVEREPAPDDAVLAVLRVRDAVHDRFVVLTVSDDGQHVLVASVYTRRPARERLAAEFEHADLARVGDDGAVAVSAAAWDGLGWNAEQGEPGGAEVLDLDAARRRAAVRIMRPRAVGAS